MKLVGALQAGLAAPAVAARHLRCAALPSNAILAALAGREPSAQRHGGYVCAWPETEIERGQIAQSWQGPVQALLPVDEIVHWDELAVSHSLVQGTTQPAVPSSTTQS